jgi:hypothetical protein
VTAPSRPPTPRAHALFRTPLGRFLALLGLVLATGLVAGFAIAWPVSQIQLNVRTQKTLNQEALAGSFDPESALATVDDVPDGWTPGDAAAAGLASPVGQSICGTTPQMQNSIADPLQAVFQNSSGKEVLVSQVFRLRSPRDANQYIQDMSDALSCSSFFTLTNSQRNKIEVRDGQPDPPISDYVSKTLVASLGGARRFAIFQVGSAVVVLTSVSPIVPPDSLIGDAQLSILNRVDPGDFPNTVKVAGAKPLPPEATTSTTAPPPTTAAPPPPSSSVTTTTVRRRVTRPTVKPRSTTTVAAPTPTAPASTAPAGH